MFHFFEQSCIYIGVTSKTCVCVHIISGTIFSLSSCQVSSLMYPSLQMSSHCNEEMRLKRFVSSTTYHAMYYELTFKRNRCMEVVNTAIF